MNTRIFKLTDNLVFLGREKNYSSTSAYIYFVLFSTISKSNQDYKKTTSIRGNDLVVFIHSIALDGVAMIRFFCFMGISQIPGVRLN